MGKVIDMKGQAMSEQTTQPPAEATPHDVFTNFITAVLEMRAACKTTDFRHLTFRDGDGRVYSAQAMMRMIDRHMNFIRLQLDAQPKPSDSRAGMVTNITTPRR